MQVGGIDRRVASGDSKVSRHKANSPILRKAVLFDLAEAVFKGVAFSIGAKPD